MSYISLGLILISIGYLLTDFYYRLKKRKYINVAIVDEDGTKRIVRVHLTGDPEVQALVSRVKNERRVAE
jgi:hypothetical protein